MENNIHIQWFPGHMTKAKREMQEKLPLVDLVIELRDARIPAASKNPLMDELCKNKPRLIILSKKDKANEKETDNWLSYFKHHNLEALALDITRDKITQPIVEVTQKMMEAKIQRQIRRGIRPRAIRAMVVGVPNVGKSTFINRFSKKKVAQTGNRPGVTRSLQWVRVNQHLELLDTPGVLWPKFEDPNVGLLLAASGAIKDDILPIEEICWWMITYLSKNYRDAFEKRYQISCERSPQDILDQIAKNRGFLLNHEELDRKRAMITFLKEVRSDKLGRITWERCDFYAS